MDGFSQKIKELAEEELKEQASSNKAVDDIEFEDSVIDIDEIQRQLQIQIEKGETEEDSPDEETETSLENPLTVTEESLKLKSTVKNIGGSAKKYVIYINPDNVDFMESLSSDERKNLINKVLSEQNEFLIKKREVDRKKVHIANVFLACITFVICFPIMFVLVNKATEVSIINYNQAKENFSKLYKQNGKIRESGAVVIEERQH